MQVRHSRCLSKVGRVAAPPTPSTPVRMLVEYRPGDGGRRRGPGGSRGSIQLSEFVDPEHDQGRRGIPSPRVRAPGLPEDVGDLRSARATDGPQVIGTTQAASCPRQAEGILTISLVGAAPTSGCSWARGYASSLDRVMVKCRWALAWTGS
jgi:hypothetical protein